MSADYAKVIAELQWLWDIIHHDIAYGDPPVPSTSDNGVSAHLYSVRFPYSLARSHLASLRLAAACTMSFDGVGGMKNSITACSRGPAF